MPRCVQLFLLMVTICLASAVSGECDEPADEPKASATDHEVIEIVLLDLLEFDEFDSVTGRETKTKIVLGDISGGSSGYLSESQLGGEGHDKGDCLIPEELRTALRQRNNKNVSLSKFKPTSKNILVKDISKFTREESIIEAFPDAKGYAVAWLPGYSEDGKAAVMRVWFGLSPHGATATFMLVKQDGKWKVKWRKAALYA